MSARTHSHILLTRDCAKSISKKNINQYLFVAEDFWSSRARIRNVAYLDEPNSMSRAVAPNEKSDPKIRRRYTVANVCQQYSREPFNGINNNQKKYTVCDIGFILN